MPYFDLEFLTDKDVFLVCDPEVPDFTSQNSSKVVVYGGGKKVEIPLSHDRSNLEKMAVLLKQYLHRTVIGWNIKGLFSFILYNTGADYILPVRILDLKVMESFVGVGMPRPTTCQEAMRRLGVIANSPSWAKLQKYYKEVAYPLMSSVLPNVETTPLIHADIKRKLYAHYTIEGQANGRLKCSGVFQDGYNPHTLSDLVKDRLRPGLYDMDFVYFDYCHMEVSVLQWLSQDLELGKIIESGRDLYAGIWEKVTNIKCTDVFREKCKSVFLPIVYGQGATSVAERLKVSEKTAVKFINTLYKAFPTAFSCIRSQQDNLDSDGFAEDFFGRRRQFKEQQYRVRNFYIQAAASTICLHKLVKLFEVVSNDHSKIIFSIHDGYGLLVNKMELPKLVKKYAFILESEEDYYPGLKLKISCKTGDRLNKLKKYIF